jgi:hypothetical protein
MIGVPTAMIAVIGTQALCTAVDELYCHRRRHLPKWERVGHPVDTFAFMATSAITALLAPVESNLALFWTLAVVTMLLVTKDEWIHKQYCDGFELWLHAVMFVLHGVSLVGLAWLWQHDEGAVIRGTVPVITGLVLIYQTLYWNWSRNDQK